jgi:hypothetical protein
MGFFSSMSAIATINQLLKDYENQVTITQDQVSRNASSSTLLNSLNVLKSLHQQLIDEFSKSGPARCATYTIFGDKMGMDALLTYSKNVIAHLMVIIKSKNQ